MFQILAALQTVGKALVSTKALAAYSIAGTGASAFASIEAGKAAEEAAERTAE